MINHAESWDTQETHKRPVPRGAQLTADLLCAGNRQASYSRTTAITPAFFHISHGSCFKFSKYINLFFFSFYRWGNWDKNYVSGLPKATQLSDQAVPRLHPGYPEPLSSAPSISINWHFISTTSTDGGNHQGRPWVQNTKNRGRAQWMQVIVLLLLSLWLFFMQSSNRPAR